jgi:hypothetical protein
MRSFGDGTWIALPRQRTVFGSELSVQPVVETRRLQALRLVVGVLRPFVETDDVALAGLEARGELDLRDAGGGAGWRSLHHSQQRGD